MARQKKVIRTKAIYNSKKIPKHVLARILFGCLLVILIGIGFLVMQQLSARFGKGADKTTSSTNQSSVVGEQSSTPESTIESNSQSSQPQPKPTMMLGSSVTISADTMLAPEWNITTEIAKAKEQGHTAIILELKAENGTLSYQSQNEMAIAYGTISEQAVDLGEIAKAITDAGLLPIAYISTLKDATAPHVSKDNSYAYSTSLETNWLDNSVSLGGKPWLNPYMDNARNYIRDISVEINQAGFDTILLDNVMFPDKNTQKMNTIKTSPDRDSILNQLVSEVQDAVPDATVIRVIDVVDAATGEARYDATILKVSAKVIGLELDLAEIEANKEKICIQNGIVTETGVPPTLTAVEVAKALIGMAQEQSDGEIVPIVSSQDFAQLEQVFEDMQLKQYLLK